MSFPNIPNITPTISISQEEVINLLLASIALEELGLAHITNAEAEKIQYILGTLPGITPPAAPTISDLETINRSVEEMLRTVVKKEMLLEFKLEDVLKISTSSTTTGGSTTTTTTTTGGSTTSTTTTVAPGCQPKLNKAVFANGNFSIASMSNITNDVQVNGNLTATHSGNFFGGITNIGGSNNSDNNVTFENPPNVGPAFIETFPTFNFDCLVQGLTPIQGPIEITSANQAQYNNQTLYVIGNVTIQSNVNLTTGGIFATGNISIPGANSTITSTGCFALYSQNGSIDISGGGNNIKGLVYTASTSSDIHTSNSHPGGFCGGIYSAGSVTFTGGSALVVVNNTDSCSLCVTCSSSTCLIDP